MSEPREDHIPSTGRYLAILAQEMRGSPSIVACRAVQIYCVRAEVFTDNAFDYGFDGKLKDSAKEGRELLQSIGVDLFEAKGVHSKAVIQDGMTMMKGSYNWLSAQRKDTATFKRKYESSYWYRGSLIGDHIQKCLASLKAKSTCIALC